MDKYDPRLEDFKLLAKAKKTRREIHIILNIDKGTVDRWGKKLNIKLHNPRRGGCNPPNNAL